MHGYWLMDMKAESQPMELGFTWMRTVKLKMPWYLKVTRHSLRLIWSLPLVNEYVNLLKNILIINYYINLLSSIFPLSFIYILILRCFSQPYFILLITLLRHLLWLNLKYIFTKLPFLLSIRRTLKLLLLLLFNLLNFILSITIHKWTFKVCVIPCR